MSKRKQPRFPFTPVPLRPRDDGWTPERQTGFIEALAESGCVEDACKAIGLSPSSAYRLRRRPEAYSFRFAWSAALDHAVERVSDNAFSRALNGVARPVFFQGVQIGERRYYNDRLAMFLLRYRDPTRYGAWRDKVITEKLPDAAAMALGRALLAVLDDADDVAAGSIPRGDMPLPAPACLEGGELSRRLDALHKALEPSPEGSPERSRSPK